MFPWIYFLKLNGLIWPDPDVRMDVSILEEVGKTNRLIHDNGAKENRSNEEVARSFS
jgi:hypothetical protein